jgi:hypothetical protein
MTNQDLNTRILLLIANLEANTAGELQKHTETDDAKVLDNTLKRLKSKDYIAFDKADKRWTVTKTGKLESLRLMGEEFISPAPPVSTVILPPPDNDATSSVSAPIGEGVELSAGNQHAEAADAGANNKENMENQHESAASVGDIDAAINEAKSKKGSRPAKEQAETTNKRPRLTDEEKKARDEERAQERAAAKAKRDEVRAAKKLEKEQVRKPAHMSKVNKAAERLPTLSETAQQIFTDASVNLSVADITALAAHLQHFNRTKATERALSQKVGEGDTVKVISGDPRFIGQTGTVTKAQRIRCYVQVDVAKKPIYLFTSDVEVITTAAPAVAANG